MFTDDGGDIEFHIERFASLGSNDQRVESSSWGDICRFEPADLLLDPLPIQGFLLFTLSSQRNHHRNVKCYLKYSWRIRKKGKPNFISFYVLTLTNSNKLSKKLELQQVYKILTRRSILVNLSSQNIITIFRINSKENTRVFFK